MIYLEFGHHYLEFGYYGNKKRGYNLLIQVKVTPVIHKKLLGYYHLVYFKMTLCVFDVKLALEFATT